MYIRQFVASVQKAHFVVFGTHTEIAQAQRRDNYAPYIPCIYIYDNNPDVYPNEYVKLMVRYRWDCLDYFLVFPDTLNDVISESVLGRDHIKPGVVIWSMVIKIIWSKVRYLYKLSNPTRRIQDDILLPTDIVECLPENFEFSEFPEAPLLDVVESFFDQDMKKYRKLAKFTATPQEIENGIIHFSVEGSVVSSIAVRCRGEEEMLAFVKRCSDLVLKKSY